MREELKQMGQRTIKRMTMHKALHSRIDKTLQNSKYRLYGDKDETINHVSECNKLVQKEYKTRHDWVGKVIHWKLWKKFKSDQFDYTNK